MPHEETNEPDPTKSKGGVARAKALPPSRRKEIARQAAKQRWSADKFPQATHEGDMNLGSAVVKAAILPDGTRLLTQSTFLQALGRSGNPKAGTGGFIAFDDLPSFLQSGELKPFITDELKDSTRPIFFRGKDSNQPAVGYNALLLPMVAEVYLSYRDACLTPPEIGGRAPGIPTKYKHIIRACDALTRGLARRGIIALVDEATGFDQAKDEYLKRVALYVAEELQPWLTTFGETFYSEIYRLKGWDWGRHVNENKNHPWAVANITNRIVYEKLPSGVLEKLRELNPKNEKGNRKYPLYKWLASPGYVHLVKHLGHTEAIMERNTDWQGALQEIDARFPSLQDPYGNPLLALQMAKPTKMLANKTTE